MGKVKVKVKVCRAKHVPSCYPCDFGAVLALDIQSSTEILSQWYSIVSAALLVHREPSSTWVGKKLERIKGHRLSCPVLSCLQS